eukprot:NODE_4238_length_683_cov_25.075710_g3605_i0.p3 GENE.NODE_4238_length_683_cov_25.075710_g3605_i0~~NODE_4238_length_683_cov_25.075710_g3605_i0.p3  ORF type:complete len:79 (+),score=19.12 NODE_4238_length_683_cov_25.075710_g3605_i0:297-533(+)
MEGANNGVRPIPSTEHREHMQATGLEVAEASEGMEQTQHLVRLLRRRVLVNRLIIAGCTALMFLTILVIALYKKSKRY